MGDGSGGEDLNRLGRSNGDDDDWTEDITNDVEVLKRVWRNEKAAPEILLFETLLVERVREQISLMLVPPVHDPCGVPLMQQEDNLAAYAETLDDLMVSIFEMDVNRTMFLLRAYMRIRLAKIENFALHIIRTTELWERLSQPEQEYAQKYVDTLSKHMHECVLDKLEKAYDSMVKQAASSEDNDMIVEPQLDTFIFCRSKGAVGSFQLDDKGDETVDLMPNDLYILRYRPVRGLLETDRIELV